VVVPLGGDFVDHHDALKRESELHKTGFPEISSQPARIFKVLIAGKFAAAQTLDHGIQLFFFQGPGIHGQERRAGSFGQFHKILPSLSRVFSRLPHHGLHFFVIDIARKTAHAMALDKGHHIVFQGR
jgi:hypothetical protein